MQARYVAHVSTGNAEDDLRASQHSTDNPYFVERELRRHFDGIRIVSELDLSADGSIFEMARDVVLKVAQHGAPDRLQRYPASTAAFLAAEGARCYDDGTFWPNIAIAPYLSSGADQSKVGRAFLSALDELGLENFSYAAAREHWLAYVSPILMHGGIPSACADEVADLVFAGLRDGIWDADDLIDRTRQSSTRWSGLAKPVQRFFEYGDEFASDLLQRVIDTAADIAELGRDATDLIVELSADAGLPRYLTQALLRDERRSTRRGRRPPRPTVRIDRYSCDGPYMTLPPFPHDGGWLIQGATTRRFATRRHDPRDIPLAPSHGWTATLEWHEHSANRQSERQFGGLERVHAYVFDASGNLTRQQRRLPASQTLILFSPGVAITDPDGMPIPSPEVLPPRAGAWNGWELNSFDLEGVAAVLVQPPPGPSGDERPTSLAVAQAPARPRFATAPVSGTRGMLGGGVFAEPPAIAMPGNADPERWRARWRETQSEGEPAADGSAENRTPTTSRLADLPYADGAFELAALLPSAPAFAGTVEVSGPLGSDIREDITVIQGLAVVAPDRVFAPREVVQVGVTADAVLNLEDGARIPEAGLSFEAGQDTVPLTAGGTTFAVTIPRLTWALRRTDGSFPTLGVERLRIGLDEIESGAIGSIMIRCGRPATLRLELRSDTSLHETGPVQANSPVGWWSFSLTEFRTTIAAATVPRLDLTLHVDDLSETVAVIEAQFIAGDLEINAELDPETAECLVSAEWTENRQFTGRQLRLWSEHRPWEQPVCVEVEDDVAGQCAAILLLPPGPYVAEITLADEWSSPTFPILGQAGTRNVLVGSELQRRIRLESLRTQTPLEALELVVVGAARSKNLDVSAAVSATDELACAMETAAQLSATNAGASNTLIDLVELVMTSDSLLPRLAPVLAELPTQVLRRLELAIVVSAQGSAGFTDWDLERLWKTLPTVAAALDNPFAGSSHRDLAEASPDRWQRFSGWRPTVGVAPVESRIEPITPPLDEFQPARLRELQQALPPSGSLPLQWGGYLEAAFEMLTTTWHEPIHAAGTHRSPDRERIKRWRSSHNAVYSYTQRFSARQLGQLDLIRPDRKRPAWHRFPADVLAAAFHLTDGTSSREGRAQAARALGEAAEIAPLLTKRSILLALGVRHVENSEKDPSNA